MPDPAFFRDGSFIELPSPVPAANGNGSILFTVNREIEGIYECGREASAGPQQRSLSEQRVVSKLHYVVNFSIQTVMSV